MKNIIMKLLVYIIVLVFCPLFLLACDKPNIKSEVAINNGNKFQDELNCNNSTSDSNEEKTKLLSEIAELSSKLSEATDSFSAANIVEEYYKINKNTINSIYFAKENGEFYIIPNQPLPEDYDARKREWYKRAIENKVYTSQFKDMLNGKFILAVSMTVSKDEKIIGVIGVDKFSASQ